MLPAHASSLWERAHTDLFIAQNISVIVVWFWPRHAEVWFDRRTVLLERADAIFPSIGTWWVHSSPEQRRDKLEIKLNPVLTFAVLQSEREQQWDTAPNTVTLLLLSKYRSDHTQTQCPTSIISVLRWREAYLGCRILTISKRHDTNKQ